MILFSHEIFSIQAVGGVSRCMIELMRGLSDLDVDWALWAGRHGNRYLRDSADIHPHMAGSTFGPLLGRTRGGLTQEGAFARYAASAKPSIVHRTYYPLIDRVDPTVKRVVSMYDMHNELYQERDRPIERLRSLAKRRALERADAISCISTSSRDLMSERWPHLRDRSVAIPLGAKPLSANPTPVTRERPFFVFVGGRIGNKNLSVVLRALMHPRLADFELICVGGGAFSESERALIAELGLGARLVQMNADDDMLAGLYNSAVALVYPSRSEGFGLPVLEAMIHQSPVITTALTSLPEAGGDAALYADPDDDDAWADAMERLAFDTEFRQKAIERGTAHAGGFTWARHASRHADLYRQLT